MSHTYSICHQCKSFNKVSIESALLKKPVCGKCKNELDMHGLVSMVDGSELERIIAKSEKPVIVDFWASWCGPCRMYGPEFEKASKENSEAVFLKLNTETNQAISEKLGIRGIPCTIIFKNGREVLRQSGAMNSTQVKDLLYKS
jgi:thioredoxin 2